MRIPLSTSIALLSAVSMVGTASAWFWSTPSATSVTGATSIQCTTAAVTYSTCVQTKYGACSGKTGTALLTCMQTASKTGTPCNPAALKSCLSASCQSAAIALQQCAQKLKTACVGKTGTALQTCLKDTKVSGCDPAPVQKCAAEVQAKASSARSASSKASTASKSWWRW
jgi:hypothetical protein